MHWSVRDARLFFFFYQCCLVAVTGRGPVYRTTGPVFTRTDTDKRGFSDSVIGVWCGVSSDRAIALIFFQDTINSERYVKDRQSYCTHLSNDQQMRYAGTHSSSKSTIAD
jgi:hypothetical protein